MEGETITTAFKATLGKLVQRHFQTLDDVFSCLIFLVCAFAIWQLFTWIISTVIRLIFPIILCFVFLILFNEHYASAMAKSIQLFQCFFTRASSMIGTVVSYIPSIE